MKKMTRRLLALMLAMLLPGTCLAAGESGKTSEDYEPMWQLA